MNQFEILQVVNTNTVSIGDIIDIDIVYVNGVDGTVELDANNFVGEPFTSASINVIKDLINKYQLTNIDVTRVPNAYLWSSLNEFKLHTRGDLYTSSLATGSYITADTNASNLNYGKLIFKVVGNINVPSTNIFEKNAWQNRNLKTLAPPYTDQSAIYTTYAQWEDFYKVGISGSVGLSSLISTLDPRLAAYMGIPILLPGIVDYNQDYIDTNGVYQPYNTACGIFPTVWEDNTAMIDGTLDIMRRGNQSHGIVQLHTSGTGSLNLIDQLRISAWNYSLVDSTIPINDVDDTYDFLSIEPIAFINFNEEKIVTFKNFKPINLPKAINANSDKWLMQRETVYDSPLGTYRTGVNNLIYEIKRWNPIIKNDIDVTSTYLPRLYAHIFRLTEEVFDSEIANTFIINDTVRENSIGTVAVNNSLQWFSLIELYRLNYKLELPVIFRWKSNGGSDNFLVDNRFGPDKIAVLNTTLKFIDIDLLVDKRLANQINNVIDKFINRDYVVNLPQVEVYAASTNVSGTSHSFYVSQDMPLTLLQWHLYLQCFYKFKLLDEIFYTNTTYYKGHLNELQEALNSVKSYSLLINTAMFEPYNTQPNLIWYPYNSHGLSFIPFFQPTTTTFTDLEYYRLQGIL